jgi:hypothetical protein
MQIIRTFGLIPYLFHFLHAGSIVSFIVFNNGILFHALLPNNSIMKWFDILCNSILVLYVNICVVNIFVFTWTIAACLCFLWNSRNVTHEPTKAILHVTGVQWGLFNALKLSGY